MAQPVVQPVAPIANRFSGTTSRATPSSHPPLLPKYCRPANISQSHLKSNVKGPVLVLGNKEYPILGITPAGPDGNIGQSQAGVQSNISVASTPVLQSETSTFTPSGFRNPETNIIVTNHNQTSHNVRTRSSVRISNMSKERTDTLPINEEIVNDTIDSDSMGHPEPIDDNSQTNTDVVLASSNNNNNDTLYHMPTSFSLISKQVSQKHSVTGGTDSESVKGNSQVIDKLCDEKKNSTVSSAQHSKSSTNEEAGAYFKSRLSVYFR